MFVHSCDEAEHLVPGNARREEPEDQVILSPTCKVPAARERCEPNRMSIDADG